MLNNDMFSNEKNGYSKCEVETFFAEMKKVHTETIRAHRAEKEKLKQELEEVRLELNEYRKHTDFADKLLKQTKAEREEILDASKECYRLEILKLSELYKEEADTFAKIKEEVALKYGSFDDAELEKKLTADRFRRKVRELLVSSLNVSIDDNTPDEMISHYEDEAIRLNKKPLRFDETAAQKVGARLSEVSTSGYSKLLSKYLVPHRTREEILGLEKNAELNKNTPIKTNKKEESNGFDLREALVTKATLDEIMEGFDFYRN